MILALITLSIICLTGLVFLLVLLKYAYNLTENTKKLIEALTNQNIALAIQLQQEKNYNNTLSKQIDEMIK